jgi:hypothetical protein
MPYTEQQRKLFHAATESADVRRRRGLSRETASELADEADRLAREGKEKPPKKEKSDSFIDLSSIWESGS